MATNTERTVYVIELRDKFTRGLRSMSEHTRRFDRSIDKVKNKSQGLAKQLNLLRRAAATAAVAGIGKMTLSLANLAGKFEEVRVAFNVMLGNKGLGGQMMQWAQEFSRSTVITFDQTVTSIRKLLAYGIREENIRPLTEMLSTIAAGVGTDRLPYLTLALGQVKSRGRLMGTELRQFREHGVDIVAEIAKGIGKSTPQVEKMVTDGLISFDMVAKAMIAMTEEGGRFHRMLEEAAKTWPGVTGILKSTVQIFLKDLIEPMMNVFKRAVVNMTELLLNLRNMIPAIHMMGKTFGQMFADMFGGVAGDSLLHKLTRAKAIAGILVVFGGIITTVFDTFAYIGDLVIEKIKSAWDILTSITDFLKNFVLTSGQTSGDDFAKINEEVNKFLAGDGGATDRFLKREGDMWNKIIEAINKPLERPKIDTGKFIENLNELMNNTEDDGGGKKKSSKLRGTGSRDIVINIGNLVEHMNVNAPTMEGSVEELQDRLRRALLTVVNDVSLTKE